MSYPFDLQNLELWTKFTSSLCKNCWAGCCTLPVEANVHDLIRLGLTTEEEAAISLKKLAKKLTKQKIIQRFDAKKQIFTLAQIAGRDCLFLNSKRLCTVYDKRPTVCRTFPKVGPKPGYCPHAPQKNAPNGALLKP